MQKPELFGLVVAARTGGTNGRSRAPDSCGGNAGAGGDWQHSVASPSGGVGAVWGRPQGGGGGLLAVYQHHSLLVGFFILINF